MKYYHKNPRQITDKQHADLRRTLSKLGDLGGIVHNLPTDEIIGGNQRGRVFDINDCEIVMVMEADEPDAQGTVGIGYVIWRGNRYAYRQVKWDEKTCEEANVVANKAGGDFDFDILANQFEVDDLLDWGFSEFELGLDIPNDQSWADAFDNVPDGDKAPFQQMTFTLHDTQAEQVKAALDISKAMGDFDTENENSNGNALARICETFVTEHG